MKKFALIGQSIGYSLSPRIHSAIFEYFGLHGFEYHVLDISSEGLRAKFSTLKTEYSGFNVTIPHKNTVVEFVDTIMSPIPAINTIKIKNGETLGYNTDIDGFRSAIHAQYLMQGDRILIIGAGGAAQAAAFVSQEMAKYPKIKAKRGEKAEQLVSVFGLSQDYKGFCPQTIINASGRNIINDDLLSDICTDQLTEIFDMSYNFEGLQAYFEKIGVRYIDGRDMLIYQAIHAAKILYEIPIDDQIDKLFNYICNAVF